MCICEGSDLRYIRQQIIHLIYSELSSPFNETSAHSNIPRDPKTNSDIDTGQHGIL